MWVDALGGSVGNPQFVADDPSGTATLILPQATFGTVGSGWTFTVALTGQDGTHFPPTRDFTATPDQFTFGACAPGGTSPICSLNPSTVPKVMDTVTPTGVSQADELNPTIGPVVLQECRLRARARLVAEIVGWLGVWRRRLAAIIPGVFEREPVAPRRDQTPSETVNNSGAGPCSPRASGSPGPRLLVPSASAG